MTYCTELVKYISLQSHNKNTLTGTHKTKIKYIKRSDFRKHIIVIDIRSDTCVYFPIRNQIQKYITSYAEKRQTIIIICKRFACFHNKLL